MASGAAGVFGACGGDAEPRSTTQPTSAFDRKPVEQPTRAEICNSQAAVAIGTAWSSALRPDQPASALTDMAEAMRRAAAAAPEEIRADFQTLIAAQIPFLEALTRVKQSGDYGQLASDGDFQAAVQRLGSPNVALATGRINQWFAAHCPKPG